MNTKNLTVPLTVVLLVLGGALPASAQTMLTGDTGCGFQGSVASVPVNFTNDGTVTALQFEVTYDPGILDAGAVGAGSSVHIGASDHVLDGQQVVSPGLLRLVLHSPSNMLVPDGPIVELRFTITSDPGGDVLLPLAPSIVATRGAVSRADGMETPGTLQASLITGPVAVSTCNGGTANLSVSATGPGTTTYQWKKDTVDVPGATSDSLDLTPLEFADVANYEVAVTNDCGTGTSESVAVTTNGVCQPTSLSAYDTGSGSQLGFNWSPNPSSDITGYRLLWGSAAGGPYSDGDTALPVGSGAVQPGFTNNTRYYFVLKAEISAQASPNSNESTAKSTSGGLLLPQLPDYGFMTDPGNDTTHPDVVTYRFPARAGEVTLNYEAYDVDSASEVDIQGNGQVLGQAAMTASSDWSGSLQQIVMSDAQVNDSTTNVLTFDNTLFADPPDTEETWGVRKVSVKLPAPTISALAYSETVQLSIQQSPSEPTLQGYDLFRATTPTFIPNPGNQIATGVSGTMYVDTDNLVDGTPYYYVARPVDSIDNPGFDSDPPVGATPCSSFVTPVVDLTVDKSGADDVELDWTEVVAGGGVMNYKLKEGPAPGSALTDTGIIIPTPPYVAPGDLSDGMTHFYRIITVDGNSNESGDPPMACP
ncbi:MAG: hypothetical protein GY716_25570 [bacterium]|nr:hypothetical protein [bacterium]